MSHKLKNPDFYDRYPALFQYYFSSIHFEKIEKLSEAGFDFYNSILKLDAIIDNQELHRIFSVLDLQESAIKKLSTLFPEDSIFWNLWQQRKDEYKEAIYLEKELHNNISDEKYADVADKKSAFGKIAIDSLYILTENKDEQLYQNLLLSHKYFSLGFQIYDDVIDFQEDFKKQQFNIAVYELSKKTDLKNFDNVEILNKIFFITGLGFELLQKSINSFIKAKSYIHDTESGWFKTIDKMQNAVSAFHENTFAYIEILKKKNSLKKIPQNRTFIDYSNITESYIRKGLDFISKDFLENYSELNHFMWLSRSEGFENDNQLHYSDTFQRAMLNDCLAHISNKFNLFTTNFFNEENNYFLERTNNDDIGAWSYFPTVNEVAADIDDLGQIMQQFILADRKKLIDKYCLKSIDIAVKERNSENGGIETWIIPKIPYTEKQKKQDFFNTTKWGRGPDVEVVANFLYALFLYDAQKYSKTIKDGINYIISQQDKDGFWKSRWYYGNYYGTYVCTRLLNCFPKYYTDTKQKSLQFLLKTQNKDGSFGDTENYILSTSFARLSLGLISDVNSQCYNDSAKFLISKQQYDGSWRAENFIKPKTNEPYKSKTLVTAFALKSLL